LTDGVEKSVVLKIGSVLICVSKVISLRTSAFLCGFAK